MLTDRQLDPAQLALPQQRITQFVMEGHLTAALQYTE
jgi:hypothetical protein